MIKNLLLSILCACGVGAPIVANELGKNTIVSSALSDNITYHNGDKFTFDYVFSYTDDIEVMLFAESDSGYDSIVIGIPVINTDSSIVLEYDPNYLPTVCDYVSFYTANSTSRDRFLLFEGDNSDDDISISAIVTTSGQNQLFTVSIPLTIVDASHFDGFSEDALPYLTKVDNGYVPPQKNNLYRIFYDFYYSLFEDSDLSAITTSQNMPFDSWLCHTLTIITLVGLVVILFLFLKWLFKVCSGLILLK